jgi:hypothetical protein
MTIDVLKKSIAFVFKVKFNEIVFRLEFSVTYSKLRIHELSMVHCMRVGL